MRLKSPAWRAFALDLRKLAGSRCQMCGRGGVELHCHHMRYDSKGTEMEWSSIIVLCSGCHNTYHESCPLPPRRRRSRLALCNEVAQVLMKAKVDVGFFLNHGEEMNQHWVSNQVISEGLLDGSVARGAKKRRKTKSQRRREAENTILFKLTPFQVRSPKALSRKWNPDPSLFTREQAMAFVQNSGMAFIHSDQFAKKYKIPDPRPKKWVSRLRRQMLIHFGLGKYQRVTKDTPLAAFNDDLDQNP